MVGWLACAVRAGAEWWVGLRGGPGRLGGKVGLVLLDVRALFSL